MRSSATPGITSPATATSVRRSTSAMTPVNALYHHSNHSGAAACKEPQGLSTEDGRRPDLQIVLPGACILTDVVVSHPLCPSHVPVGSTTVLAVAQQAARRKQVKYQEVAATQLAHFIPFAVEATGGIGQDAQQLIDQLSLASKDHLTLPSHHPFANAIHSSVAIFVCYFVFDWWGVSTAIKIRL